MRINNKGFTLVEVLAVVVILGVIAGIAVYSVLSSINKSKEASYNMMVDNIIVASKNLYEELNFNNVDLYKYDFNGTTDEKIVIVDNNTINVNLQTLVSNGFLTGSNNECSSDCTNSNKKIILNPKNSLDIGDCKIKIVKSKTDSFYVLKDDDDDKCPFYNGDVSQNNDVTIEDGDDIDKIGTKVKCGGENFYVLDNSSNELKLFAEYNLDVGLDFHRIDVTDKFNVYMQTHGNDLYGYCHSVYGDENVDSNIIDGKYFCSYFSEITKGTGIQSKKAIGAHGTESGKPDPDEYGIIGMIQGYDDDNFIIPNDGVYSNYYVDAQVNPERNLSRYKSYEVVSPHLSYYQNYLKWKGCNTNSVNLIAVSEIDTMVKKVSGSGLPLSSWGYDGLQDLINSGSLYKVDSISENLSSNYKWMYSTTYWTRTVSSRDYGYYIYFVDTLGNLCSSYECNISVGAGIRPVITIDKSNLKVK